MTSETCAGCGEPAPPDGTYCAKCGRRSGPLRASWSHRAYWKVFLVGFVLYLVAMKLLAASGNPNLVPTVIVLGAFLVPVTFVVFLYENETLASLAPWSWGMTGGSQANASAASHRRFEGVFGRFGHMAQWKRWQDWANVVLGVILFITPFIFDGATPAAPRTALVLGVLIVLVDLSLPANLRALGFEWVQVALGILLFIAPWVLGFASLAAMT